MSCEVSTWYLDCDRKQGNLGVGVCVILALILAALSSTTSHPCRKHCLLSPQLINGCSIQEPPPPPSVAPEWKNPPPLHTHTPKKPPNLIFQPNV